MTPHETGAVDALPELKTDRVDRMEAAIFAGIARERSARRVRRGRLWMVGGAAAAVIVVAAVIAPSVGGLVGGASMNESAVAPAPAVGTATDDGAVQLEKLPDAAAGSAEDTSRNVAGDTSSIASDGRDIITTASATVVVDDTAAAAQQIGAAAEARGGYVESLSIGQSGQIAPVDGGVVTDSMPYPYPYPPTGAWVSVRVPSDDLSALLDDLSGIGEVTASTVNRQDVTDQTVDLRARVAAAQASVDRMTEILTQAGNLTDLIAAESALAERQATLESYEQQLNQYDTQIALSTVTVSLTTPTEVVQADPAGFGDGLAAGWSGLIATLNGIVIAIGFLLPWIALIGVAALIVWTVVRLIRRLRRARAAERPPAPGDHEA